jgi:hypothetical protein
VQCRLKYKDDPVKSQAIPTLEVIQYAKGNGMKGYKKTNDFHTMAHLYLWADNNALEDLLKAQSIDTIKIEMLEKPIMADVEMVGDAGSEFDEEEEQDDLFVDEGAAKEIEEALDPLPKNVEGRGRRGGRHWVATSLAAKNHLATTQAHLLTFASYVEIQSMRNVLKTTVLAPKFWKVLS